MTDLAPLFDLRLADRIGQLRAVPVRRRDQSEPDLLLIHAAQFDCDPAPSMFFFPDDGLHLALIDPRGAVRWRHDVGRATMPGVWFSPVTACDLDGDGEDELYQIEQGNRVHPLDTHGFTLVRRRASDGVETARIPLPYRLGDMPMYAAYRWFLMPARAQGRMQLIVGQGTYLDMFLTAYDAALNPVWECPILRPKGQAGRGAAGSHMCPVVDLDGNGDEVVLWGERAIQVRDGVQRWCADRYEYQGHTDIVQPFRSADGTWRIFTCRESDPGASPRIVTFSADGTRAWGAVEQGHIDVGWVARLAGDDGVRHISYGLRIGAKSCGPDGRTHQQREPFVFDAVSGAPRTLPFDPYQTVPVDLDGDGVHALIRAIPGGDGTVFDGRGTTLGRIPCAGLALAGRVRDLPGEQVLVYHADGRVALWADRAAQPSASGAARYADPHYARWQQLGAVGYHLSVLGGL